MDAPCSLYRGSIIRKEEQMNHLYESMFIVNPDLGEEEQEKISDRLNATIEKNKGLIIRKDDLGIKSLAYKINKKPRGHYFLLYIEGPGTMVPEIERFLRIDENIMRSVVIKLEPGVKREDLEPKEEPEADSAPEPVAESPAEAPEELPAEPAEQTPQEEVTE